MHLRIYIRRLSLLFYNHKIKSPLYSRFYAEACVTSGGAHLRGLAPGRHTYEETPHWWRTVRYTVPD